VGQSGILPGGRDVFVRQLRRHCRSAA
jgi:hypothetical protein